MSLKAKRGFALLLTITLLAFLVVLLIGLAAYTRVESAVAGNTQRQAQARQNALLGLNVALGQLQQNAGPDQRVTATGQAFGSAGAINYTGVWSTAPAAAGATPLTWLVSGSEKTNATPDGLLAAALDPTTAATTTQEFLIGDKTVSDKTQRVKLAKQNITTVGAPGFTGTTPATIGRYAWWVGDQGVKAPVGLMDNSVDIAYAPYDSTELRSRIRQQVSLGAGPLDAQGNVIFEPRDTTTNARRTNNVVGSSPVERVVALNQIALLKNSSGTNVGLSGSTGLQTNYFSWSPNNLNVLANTKLGGLRQDLSLDPTLLGPAFAAWAQYENYMEQPSDSNSLLRRYQMRSASSDGVGNINPVLSCCLLTFSVRAQDVTNGSSVKPIEWRARWMISLWNPYTSALVPEQNLRLQVFGLPQQIELFDETANTSAGTFDLTQLFGSPLRIQLPWDNSNGDPDRQSWLPGRAYSWVSLPNLNLTDTSADNGSQFYSQDLGTVAGQGVEHLLNNVTLDQNHVYHLNFPSPTNDLRFELYAERTAGDVILATFYAPEFIHRSSDSFPLSGSTYPFSFVFRLGESSDGLVWLSNPGIDPRSVSVGAQAYVYQTTGVNGDPKLPESFKNYEKISAPDRLLDRATANHSYDADTPVFELPRAPIVSLGSLQHVAISGQQPFAIGNSWGTGALLNNPITSGQAFDQFYFSGLESTVVPDETTVNWMLPNPMLKRLRNSATNAFATVADLRAAPNARTSKFLLQGGAFNLNSTNTTAWAAMLRSSRLLASAPIRFLNANFATGTAGGGTTKILPRALSDVNSQLTDPVSGDAVFFRFPQSAQETYKADDPKNGVTYAASTVPPPADPNPASTANKHLFRVGIRKLTSAQVTALAKTITTAIAAHQATSGPFRSLEDFLSPATPGNPSLIEQAIIDADSAGAGINSSVAEFSSQFLTQGDIMTALAPVLFSRSDTFVIRSYGEAVNPATNATEGRAWCEAVVQRVPDYFDPADPAETAPDKLTSSLNGPPNGYGRRFKIVSFRWLTRSDI